MASSGSTDFALNRDQIIYEAGLDVRAWPAGTTPGPEKTEQFNRALNAMVKHWQTIGIRIWKISEATLFPQASQFKYGVGTGATDHVTESFVQTTLSAAEASGQTVISVTSSTGMTAADNVGIVMDDGTVHWSTIASVDSATQITIDDATDDDAAAGNYVYAYTTRIVRPLEIFEPLRYAPASKRTTPIGPMIARTDYLRIPNRQDTGGSINQVHYDPERDIGYIYIWQAPSSVSDLLQFPWKKPIEDFDAAADTPDFPQEWNRTLRWNLAAEMLHRFPVPDNIAARIERNAAQFLDEVGGFDREAESFLFQPARRHR